nr:MAG TPA: hypothetical protein [Crassvirales sp.]
MKDAKCIDVWVWRLFLTSTYLYLSLLPLLII